MIIMKKIDKFWLDKQSEFEKQFDNDSKDIQRTTKHLYDETEDKIVNKIESYHAQDGNVDDIADRNKIKSFQNRLYYTDRSAIISSTGKKKMSSLNRLNMTKSDLFRSEIDYELIMLGSNEELNVKTWKERGFTSRTERDVREFKLDRIPTKEVNNLITELVDRKYYGKNYSERIWGRNDKVRTWVKSRLYDYASKGQDPRELIEELSTLFDVSLFEAERLAITEYGNIQSEATNKIFEYNGVEKYNVIPETGACSQCLAVASEGPYKLSERQIGVNAEMLHPYCRCSSIPVKKED